MKTSKKLFTCFIAIIFIASFVGLNASKRLSKAMKKAVKENNLNLVLKILENKNFDINYKRNTQSTSVGVAVLLSAVRLNYIEIAKALLENGVNPNETINDITSPLSIAVYHRKFEMAQLLLQNHANPNAIDLYDATPLFYATVKNDYELVKLLLLNKANPNIASNFIINYPKNQCDESSSLSFNTDKSQIIRLFKSANNPNTNAINKKGITPLLLAIMKNNYEIVKLLLQNNANPNTASKNGADPLYLAKITSEVFNNPKHNILFKLDPNSFNHDMIRIIKDKIRKLELEEIEEELIYKAMQNSFIKD